MHTRTTIAGAAVLAALLTACGGGGGGSTDNRPAHRAPATTAVSTPPTHFSFGQVYTWPDGLRISVISARVFTDYADGESHSPGTTDFRVTLRVANDGQAPVDLGQLSVIVQGATTGGQSQATTFENGSEPLEGQLAPGTAAFKNDDESLETRYGRRIVVRVQRVAEDPTGDTWPEFTGTVAG